MSPSEPPPSPSKRCRCAWLTCAKGARQRIRKAGLLITAKESLATLSSLALSAHVSPPPSRPPPLPSPTSPPLCARVPYFSCSLSHSLFSVSLGHQTGVQSTFTTFYEVECDGIDGGRGSQLSTHLPTCAEGATLANGGGDSSMVSNFVPNLYAIPYERTRSWLQEEEGGEVPFRRTEKVPQANGYTMAINDRFALLLGKCWRCISLT